MVFKLSYCLDHADGPKHNIGRKDSWSNYRVRLKFCRMYHTFTLALCFALLIKGSRYDEVSAERDVFLSRPRRVAGCYVLRQSLITASISQNKSISGILRDQS